MQPTVSVEEQGLIESATEEALLRIRTQSLKTLRCKEVEEIIDGNFRLNDEVFSTVQQAWPCAMRLECQLGEADRPRAERNSWLQKMAAEKTILEETKAEMEVILLRAKLEVQTALATSGKVPGNMLADVFEKNIGFRKRLVALGRDLEVVLCSARQSLRSLGEKPDNRIGSTSSATGNTKRWQDEFEAARSANDALLKALAHSDAAVAVPAFALEERYDHNWRFQLELVGLLEKVMAQETDMLRSGEAANMGIDAKPQATESSLLEEAQGFLNELEEQLPALLESKHYVQEAAAHGSAQDVDRAEAHFRAATQVQTDILRSLKSHSVDLTHIIATKFAEEMLPHPAAFGNARSGDAGEWEVYPPVLHVLTYNIFMRAPAPHFLHNTDDDRKDERLSRFNELLSRYDVVFLQDVFGAFSYRRDRLIEAAAGHGLWHSHRSHTDVWPNFLTDAGLLILSRLPMVERSSLTFTPGVLADRLAAKGALYAKLRCGVQGPFLHVCTTHLQATASEASSLQARKTRCSQVAELVEFLRQAACDDPVGGRRWPLLLGADLSCNGRRSALDGSHSDEYRDIMHQLREGLGEVRDLLFDICGSHPVTYADTKLNNSGEVPVERVLTAPSAYQQESLKRQRLDYLLFFPAPAGFIDAGSSPSDGVPAGSWSNGREPVVPATCRVEKFLVDRAKDVGAPITQLSDHYGVEATLTVIEEKLPETATDELAGADPGLADADAEESAERLRSTSETSGSTARAEEVDMLRSRVEPDFWAAADAFARGLSPADESDYYSSMPDTGQWVFAPEEDPTRRDMHSAVAGSAVGEPLAGQPEDGSDAAGGPYTAYVRLAR